MSSMTQRVAVLAAATIAAAAMLLGAGGCASATRYADVTRLHRGPTDVAATPTVDAVRRLPMYDGRDGAPLGWPDVLDAIAWADVIVVGEQHDDAIGHAVQRAVVEDTVRGWPGSALSMEMLERDEQDLVSDYFDGIIDAKQFERLTFSTNWGGKGKWAEWYQPIVDAVRDGRGYVIAANAPRRYVRLARTDGYARLAALPPRRRATVDHPARLPGGTYRERFWEVMTSPAMVEAETPAEDEDEEKKEADDDEEEAEADADADADSAEAPTSQPETPNDEEPDATEATEATDATDATGEDEVDDEPEPPAEEDEHVHEEGQTVREPPSDAEVEALFRSQLVWDTTMARSIAAGRRAGARKVVHLVGQFHSDFEGGTVQQLRASRPSDRVLVISMQREWPDALREEDVGRADIVIYTGERPPEPEEDEKDEKDEDVDDEGDANDEEGDDEEDATEAPTSQPETPVASDDEADDGGDRR